MNPQGIGSGLAGWSWWQHQAGVFFGERRSKTTTDQWQRKHFSHTALVGRFGGNTSPSCSTGKRRSQNSATNHSELRRRKWLDLTKRENCDKASVVCTAKANCKLQCKFQIAKLRNCIPLNCFKYLSVIQCIQCWNYVITQKYRRVDFSSPWKICCNMLSKLPDPLPYLRFILIGYFCKWS